MTLQYDSPIDGSAATSPIDPLFKSVLGDYSQASTLVGNLYNVLGGIATFISDTKSSANSFGGGYASIGGSIG